MSTPRFDPRHLGLGEFTGERLIETTPERQARSAMSAMRDSADDCPEQALKRATVP